MRSSRSTTSMLLVIGLAGAILPVRSALAAPTCFGKRATIVGTNRDERRSIELEGTRGDDVIVSRGGSDLIRARGGDDLICARGGDDIVEAGPGNDKIRGGDGIEEVDGGGGDDSIWGGRSPADTLRGNRGHDRLYGGRGAADTLLGGPGDDVMNGGRGRDIVLFADSPQGVHVDLSTGQATGQGNDVIASAENAFGTFFDDVLYGDDRSNTLGGGPGDDELHGLQGDDHLRSGEGAEAGTDLLDGGDGLDTANYYLSWDPVHADLVTGQAVTNGSDTLESIENLFGSKHDDVLTGDDGDNLVQGSLGNDVMDGGGGTDVAAFRDSFELVVDLAEGTATEDRGSDTLEGFEGVIGSAYTDTIVGDDGSNSIWGGAGADSLIGAGGDDTLVGERGDDRVNGGDGIDTCDGETEIDCELDAPAARRARIVFLTPHDVDAAPWERLRAR